MGKLFSPYSIVGICNIGFNYAQGYPQQLWVTGGWQVLKGHSRDSRETLQGKAGGH